MKYGIREICDVVLKAKSKQKIGNKVFYKDEPVCYFDSLKTSTMEGAATTVYAQGGRGNARLVAWEGERTVTFTMEDALISTEGLALLTGAGIVEPTKEIKKDIIEQVLSERIFPSNQPIPFIMQPEGTPYETDRVIMNSPHVFLGQNQLNSTKGRIKEIIATFVAAADEEVPAPIKLELLNQISFDARTGFQEYSEESSDEEGYYWNGLSSEPLELVLKDTIVKWYSDGGIDSFSIEGYEGVVSLDAVIEAYEEVVIPANTIPVHVTETTAEFIKTNTSVTITQKHSLSTESNAGIYIMPLKNGVVYTEPYLGKNVDGKIVIEEGSLTLDGITRNYKPVLSEFDLAEALLLDYYTDKDSGVQQIEITPDKFGGNYYLEASTLFRDTNGVDMPAEFIIPNCKIQSNFTFSMASSGDPSTFTFTMDAFPDYTRFDKTKKVLSVIQVITDSDDDKSKVRKSTDSSLTESK